MKFISTRHETASLWRGRLSGPLPAMRKLKKIEPSEEATVALAHRRLIDDAFASEIPCRPRKLRELPAPHLRSHRRRSGICLCNPSLL